jgi:hypothetical protein
MSWPAWTMIQEQDAPNYASHVAGMTGVFHHAQLFIG